VKAKLENKYLRLILQVGLSHVIVHYQRFIFAIKTTARTCHVLLAYDFATYIHSSFIVDNRRKRVIKSLRWLLSTNIYFFTYRNLVFIYL